MPAYPASRTRAARVVVVSDKAVPKESQETFARITQVDASENSHFPSLELFRAAWSDLVRGFLQHELWLQLGWQDIKQRYRRSMLGPLWITIATGVMAATLGLLYSVLFKVPVEKFSTARYGGVNYVELYLRLH